MQIEMISVNDPKPYANNPRKNDKAVKPVAESIKNFGFKVPLVVTKGLELITGHTRLRAAIKLGLKEVPCIIAKDLTPDQIKAFRIADNKTSEFAEWDVEALMRELSGITLDMTVFGVEKVKVLGDVEEDEFDINPPKNPVTKPGDIYKLGNHRLICGDSTDGKVLERLMDMDLADCLITDPPYNIDYEGGVHAKRDKILNDNLTSDAFGDFLRKAFTAAAQAMKRGAAFYIWHADKEIVNFRLACEHAGLEVKQTLIWNKSSFTLGRQDYQWKHEPVLYGWKIGGSHYFTDARTWSTIFEETVDIEKLKLSEAKELLKRIYASVPTTIIDVEKPLKSADHPTMKPIKLIATHVLNSTLEGQIIIDTFGGSGTTLIVAEQLNRKCYMVELDPQYCDVIVARWESYTGQKAQKLK